MHARKDSKPRFWGEREVDGPLRYRLLEKIYLPSSPKENVIGVGGVELPDKERMAVDRLCMREKSHPRSINRTYS